MKKLFIGATMASLCIIAHRIASAEAIDGGGSGDMLGNNDHENSISSGFSMFGGGSRIDHHSNVDDQGARTGTQIQTDGGDMHQAIGGGSTMIHVPDGNAPVDNDITHAPAAAIARAGS